MKNPERHKQVCRACIYGIGFLATAVAICIGFAIVVAKDPNACPPTSDEACSTFAWNVLAFVPFTILLIGAIGAGVQTFRAYRKGAEYQQWHIVTWLLLVCMVTYAGFATAAMAGGA